MDIRKYMKVVPGNSSQKTDQSQENDSTIQGNEGEPVREVNSSQNRTSESVSENCDSAESDTESNDTGDEASDHEEMTDESEDDNCELVTITKRRISTKKPSKSGKIQKFSAKWMEEKDLQGWLQRYARDKTKPWCRFCERTITGGLSHLRRHAVTASHMSKVDSMKNQVIIADGQGKDLVLSGAAKEREIISRQVTALELAMSAWVASNSKEMSMMDSLPALLKKFIPDSSVVKRLACGRTKTTGLIKNVIAPYAISQLSSRLQESVYSLMADESTDRCGTKYLVIILRYYNGTTCEVKEDFLAIPEVEDTTALGLKNLIYKTLSEKKISLEKCIGFASDNASVMLGRNNGLAALIKRDIPWLAVFGCICHSFALCSASACEKSPTEIVRFSNDTYTYVSNSTKRLREFKEFQKFCEIAEHALLYPSATRWLAFEAVSQRLVEQWTALTLFFTEPAIAGRDQTAVKLYAALTDPKVKLYYLFLNYVLPIVNRLNVEFQSTEVKVHKLLRSVGDTLTELARNYIKDELLAIRSVFEIDFSNPRNFRTMETEMHFGAEFELFAIDQIDSRKLQERQLATAKKHCLAFYIKLFSEIKRRVNSEDPLLRMLDWLSPETALSGSVPSIIPLYRMFRDCFSGLVNVEVLNREWRRLPLLKKDLKEGKMPVLQFWNLVSTLKDGIGDPAFTDLPIFMKGIMSLPHSSASAERQFSALKLIRTPLRNRLLPETISDMMHVKREVPNPETWDVLAELIRSAKKWKP